jgi:tetratricopeptide (TPR) repeat protein
MQFVPGFSSAQTVPAASAPTAVGRKLGLWILDSWRDLVLYVCTPSLLVPVFIAAQGLWGAEDIKLERLASIAAELPTSAHANFNYATLDAHIDLGSLLFNKGELAEAKECFQKASEFNPKLAQPHNYLGEILMREGNVAQAITQFQEALRLPDFPEAEGNLRVAKETRAQSP